MNALLTRPTIEEAAAAQGKDKSWEISWVSYGFSNGKVVCFAS